MPKSTSKSTAEIINPDGMKIKNQGKMEMQGILRAFSYSGIEIETLKDAMEYYININDTPKALVAAAEGYRLYELSAIKGAYHENAPRLVAQFYDKLLTIAIKYVSIVNIPLVMAVCKLVIYEDRDFSRYITMVHLLSDTKKSRQPFYIKYGFLEEEGREKAENYKIDVDIVEEPWNEDDYTNFVSSIKDLDKELVTALIQFRMALLDQRLRVAFNWLYQIQNIIFESNTKPTKSQKMTKIVIKENKLPIKIPVDIIDMPNRTIGKDTIKSSYLLWKAMEDLLDKQFMSYMMHFYYSNSSKKNKDYYLITAILTVIFKMKQKELDLEQYVTSANYESERLKEGKYELDISDFKKMLQSQKNEMKKKNNKMDEIRIKENYKLEPISEIFEVDLPIRRLFTGEEPDNEEEEEEEEEGEEEGEEEEDGEEEGEEEDE